MDSTLGPEATLLDARISDRILDSDREQIWKSANRILDLHTGPPKTVLALGYVQSGKTTSIAALCAAAADRGFKVIVAILGSTTLLKDQNRSRVEEYLGVEEHNYRWVSFSEFNQKRTPREIDNWLARERVILIPVLKNPSVIKKVTKILAALDLQDLDALVVDDEADQASLNTALAAGTESSTYSAIQQLRSTLPKHLYVQYTATPYAPLLLPETDPLMPSALEFLLPGHGYTGGREFFIDHADAVLRAIPASDEQNARTPLSELPESLETALASFISGSAHLFFSDKSSAPISMLIHSTFKNDLQERYHFLVERYLERVRTDEALPTSDFGLRLQNERERLNSLGIQRLTDEDYWTAIRFVLRECTLTLVNSATEIKKIQWHLAPFHILIGGNKLDRGFTVEGLTVTYMNRPPSEQIDTVEQRARAFGYRTTLLPYCQFFASARTLKTLRGIVHTEDDLRANLRDVLDSGGTVSSWAKGIGLFLPVGTKPTRDAVVPALRNFNPDGNWFVHRKPLLDADSRRRNDSIIADLSLLEATPANFQRLAFRHIEIPLDQLIDEVLGKWTFNPASPGWRHDDIREFLSRHPNRTDPVHVLLMEEGGAGTGPRTRKWADDTGFINLFQGRDLPNARSTDPYLGDRKAAPAVFGSEAVILQIHRLLRRDHSDGELFTLAIHLGEGKLVRRQYGTG